MAPEQFARPADVDHRADIYSLGVVFYQMLTGELPKSKLEPPSRKVQIDVRLDEIVLRALQKEPERRYQQASVLKTQVETVAQDQLPPNRPSIDFESGRRAPVPNARFSRLAITGATWIPFAFIFLLGMLWPMTVVQTPPGTVAPGPTGPTPLQITAMIVLGALGLTAPFGTTICGIISISQIRRSRGQLYGLGLAVFDLLFFPLLLLDGLIGLAWGLIVSFFVSVVFWSQVQYFSGVRVNNFCWAIVILATVLASIPVDLLIIRRAWHAANKPPNGNPNPETLKTPPAGPRINWKMPLTRTTVFLVLFLFFAGILAPLPFVWMTGQLRFAVPGFVFLYVAFIVVGATQWRSQSGKAMVITSLVMLFLGGFAYFEMQFVRQSPPRGFTTAINPGKQQIMGTETISSNGDVDFVLFHPLSQSTAWLDAARDWVIKHHWQLISEGGSDNGVTIHAADPHGRQASFLDVPQRNGMARFTIHTEVGASLDAGQIGSQLKLPGVNQPTPAQTFSPRDLKNIQKTFGYSPPPGTDFYVLVHPQSESTKYLNASRNFVFDHHWQHISEGGDIHGVTMRAADPHGRQITFEEVPQSNGKSRFSISTEAGALLNAGQIASQLKLPGASGN